MASSMEWTPLLEEHLRIKGRTTWYETVEEVQKIWTCTLRPTTSVGPTTAAVWKSGGPTKSSRPGSPESEPASPQPGRR